jgi:predicted alpha/beta-hydrolase family hydrolase
MDYPYRLQGSHRPDPLPILVAAHRAVVATARTNHRGEIVLAGKSMGGRIGCHVALEEEVSALVCFSYPLCGGGDPKKMRAEVLRKLTTPILFIQGTRDPLCPLELLAEVRREMQTKNTLYIVEGADHSLAASKTRLRQTGESQEDVDRKILQVVREFLRS